MTTRVEVLAAARTIKSWCNANINEDSMLPCDCPFACGTICDLVDIPCQWRFYQKERKQ
jgi:hypothetical protein